MDKSFVHEMYSLYRKHKNHKINLCVCANYSVFQLAMYQEKFNAGFFSEAYKGKKNLFA